MRGVVRYRRLGVAKLLTLVVVLTISSMSACARDDAGPPGDDSAGVTLTWYATATDQNQNDYRQVLVNEFRNAYPDIKINLVSPRVDNTDAIREELRAVLPTDDAPDVYLGDVIWPAEFAEAGLARPLDADFDATFWKRFPPHLLSAMTYRDQIYAVPFFSTQGVLYYRKDLVPVPPTTWEQLVETSADLVLRDRVLYGFAWQGAAYEGLTCTWTEVLADAGGRTVDTSQSGVRQSGLDSPAARRALEFMVGLLRGGVAPPPVTGFEEFDANQLFMAGEAAFMRGWNTAYTRMNVPDGAVYDNIGVAPLPTFADQPQPGYSTTGGWSLYVNPNTRHFEAAETFVRWLTDVQAQTIIARFSHLPTNSEVRAGPDARQNPAVAVGLDARPVVRPASSPDYPAVSQIVYTAVNGALDGDPPVEAALLDADRRLDEELAPE